MEGVGDASGAYNLAVTCPRTPTFVGTITCGQVAIGNTTGANQTVGLSAPAHWFAFNAVASGTFFIDSCGSSFDTVIRVFRRTGTSPVTGVGVEIATCDDAPACGNCGGQGQLSRFLTAGSYWIVIDGFSLSTGVYRLSISYTGTYFIIAHGSTLGGA